MDFKACAEILQSRHLSSGACDSCIQKQPVLCRGPPTIDPVSKTSTDMISSMETLELLNLFTRLQGERVQIYLAFDASLKLLIENSRIAEYPHLCAEVTSIFSVLSKQVIAIKDAAKARTLDTVSDTIQRIQELEKDKLVLVAAKHLETIHYHFPSLKEKTAAGITLVAREDYITQKIADVELAVGSLLEDIQAIKCDLF